MTGRRQQQQQQVAKRNVAFVIFKVDFLRILQIRLWGVAQVWFHNIDAFREFFDGIFGRNGGYHNHVFAAIPVGRCGHAVISRELQRIQHPQYLVEIAARGSRVGDGQFYFFIWPDDKQRAHREILRRIGVNHAVKIGYRAVGVGDDWEVDRRVLGFVDVFHPAFVFVERIHAHGEDFGVAAAKLLLELRRFAEFGGANGRVVGRMREQDAPAFTDEIIKIYFAGGGLGFEIGGSVAKS